MQIEEEKSRLIYDGHCPFCVRSVRRLKKLDLFGDLVLIDFHAVEDPSRIDRCLTPEMCQSELQLLTKDGKRHGGFYAFRRLSRILPLLWPLVPILYFPGIQTIGSAVYARIAKRRLTSRSN